LELGREAQRSLVYSSDVYYGYGFLDPDPRDRDFSRVFRGERSGGNFFGNMFTLEGALENKPGTGKAYEATGKVEIQKFQREICWLIFL
jgi:hypothetical protein